MIGTSVPGLLPGLLIPTSALCRTFVAFSAYVGSYGRHVAVSNRPRLRLAIVIAVLVVLWGTVHTIVKLTALFF